MLRAALAAVLLAATPADPDALRIIDNTLRHEGPPPVHATPLARELLAEPLRGQDARAIFERATPRELIDGLRAGIQVRPFDEVLRRYLLELEAAQDLLRAATGEIDAEPVLRRLPEGLPSADQFLRIGAAVDSPALAKATSRFIAATLRFSREARVATGFPGEAMQFQSPIGLVSIGTMKNDRHPAGAALIIDPGGDDEYERAPVTGNAVSVIVDFAGNDRYSGSDVVVGGLSAIVDLEGNDRYEMRGPGLAAALGGVSLVVDAAGDDRYSAGYFAQGAAAFGFAALVDLAGNDEYRISGWGQGFAAAGGVGLLWDRDGDDAYFASGEADSFGRGAALSGAQGAAFGFRSMLGGGIGILRDENGNDRYHADMFAQGTGYFYAVGLLWDEGGDDRYRAVRYAQGSGSHQSVGILRDERGDDRYELSVGVGQGMGLDLALGVLVDGGGNDQYRAPLLAQGTATANGIGLLVDTVGDDRFEVRDPGPSWGEAEWAAGLPSIGIFRVSAQATLVRNGKPLPPVAEAPCPNINVAAVWEGIATLRKDHFDAVNELGWALRCAVLTSSSPESLWQEILRWLQSDPETPLARAVAEALGERPPEGEVKHGVAKILEANPRCSVRAAVVVSLPQEQKARAALGSPCYRLQAAGVQALRVLGLPVPRDAALPSFLSSPPAPPAASPPARS